MAAFPAKKSPDFFYTDDIALQVLINANAFFLLSSNLKIPRKQFTIVCIN